MPRDLRAEAAAAAIVVSGGFGGLAAAPAPAPAAITSRSPTAVRDWVPGRRCSNVMDFAMTLGPL